MADVFLVNDGGNRSSLAAGTAPGRAPCGLGDILALDHNWSAAGHSKAMHKPLRVNRYPLIDGVVAYAATGAPSVCVALALLCILPGKPDLVVSGINQGDAVGHDLAGKAGLSRCACRAQGSSRTSPILDWRWATHRPSGRGHQHLGYGQWLRVHHTDPPGHDSS